VYITGDLLNSITSVLSQPVGLYIILGVLVVLILLSAFFSSAETALMSLNKYRLRHLVRKGDKKAKRIHDMLKRPDRLISTILIGNNFVNILASSLVTIVVIQIWSDAAIPVSSLVLTFVILIFGEITPKTIASLHSEKIAFSFTLFLLPLYKILNPIVILVNWICSLIVKPFGVFFKEQKLDSLNSDELRSLVDDAYVAVPKKNKFMLLGILDLENIRVDDVMIPRNNMVGIDINNDISTIINKLQHHEYHTIPVYQENMDNMLGILHSRGIAQLLAVPELNKTAFMNVVSDPHYVPVSTNLYSQLINFQKNKERSAFVVDEYGEILGVITLEDILEEIVGEFTNPPAHEEDNIINNDDGSYIIDGSASIRSVNKQLNWHLPIHEARTINGLITETMESIPCSKVCWKIGDYYFEIIQVKNNRVKAVKMFTKKDTGQQSDTNNN
jgi:Mg2+/Co2+ transporter CorB